MATDLFAELDAPTAAVEGGYSNNPNDAGGETNHGITIKAARQNGYMGPMVDLTAAQAAAIRKTVYYMKPGIYLIADLSEKVAAEVYDSGVNCGPGTAVMWFQRCLNVLGHDGADYAKITVDGVIGPKTVAALHAYLTKRGVLGETVMLRALNSLQGNLYIVLTEQDERDSAFTFGWFANRVTIS